MDLKTPNKNEAPTLDSTLFFCAATSERFALIGRFVATVFDKVSFPGERWSDIAISGFAVSNLLLVSLILFLWNKDGNFRTSLTFLESTYSLFPWSFIKNSNAIHCDQTGEDRRWFEVELTTQTRDLDGEKFHLAGPVWCNYSEVWKLRLEDTQWISWQRNYHVINLSWNVTLKLTTFQVGLISLLCSSISSSLLSVEERWIQIYGFVFY